MGMKKLDAVKNAKDFVTENTSKVFSNGERSHMTIPVEREINEKELVNLVASFICSHEGVPIERASVGQEGNNHIVQVRKLITNKAGKVTQVETFTVQFSFMPKACIIDFSTNKGKAEKEKLKKGAGAVAAVEAGLIGVASVSATVATGAVVIGLSPLAIGAMPIAGAYVTAKALSASGKRKESRQLKDEVYAIVCDYVGYIPNTQTESAATENVNIEKNETTETVAKVCECGNIIPEGAKFCPQCGKSVDAA